MNKVKRKVMGVVIAFALAISPSTRVLAQYTSVAPQESDVTITNNAGTSDVIYVTNLYGGETIKVYNAATAGKQIGSGKCSSTKTEASFTITQLGKTGGNVYISITAAGELESARTAVSFESESQTDILSQDQVTVTNYSGKADLINVSGLYGEETIKVYDAQTGGKQLGIVKVSSSSTDGVVKITQIGANGGIVYVSVTQSCELESERLAIDFAAEGQSAPPSVDNITIVNNAGTADTVRINNLSTGDSVNIYDLAKGGSVIGTGTVASGKTDLNLVISQIGSTAGNIYVAIISTNKRESSRTGVAYAGEGLSTAPAASNITVTNNANANDTVIVNGLSAGDIIYIYNAATGGLQLGTATAASSKTSCTITLAQLGMGGGYIYVSTKSKGYFESSTTQVAYAVEETTDAIGTSDIIITNNSGKSDTVIVSNCTVGDIVKVYDVSAGGAPIGITTVAAGKTEATVTISQLGTAAGSVYLSITGAGENESNRTAIAFSAEPVSDTVDDYDVTITNNPQGKSDTVKIINLAAGDVAKIYDAKTSGNLLGTAAASAAGTAIITITQLSETAGSVYIAITGKNATESSRVKMTYEAESQSDILDSEDVIVTNNVDGTDDTIEATGLDENDIIKVYDSMTGGELLGTGVVKAGEAVIIISIEQLGEAAGSIYLTLTGEGELESSRILVAYSAEEISSAVVAEQVVITNNAISSDTIVVSGTTGGDVVTAYSTAKGSTVVGTATTEEFARHATVTIKQLGSDAGTIYITITSEGKEESDRTAVSYSGEKTTENIESANVSVTNNANNSDTVEVSNLSAADLVKVYDAGSGGTLLGKAVVDTYGSTVAISVTQLGSQAGNIFITITSEDEAESDRIQIAYAAEALSDAPSSEDVQVSNNVNTSDIIQVTGLDEGDVVKIYNALLAGKSLGSETVDTYGTNVSIVVSQLGSAAGTIYVTVTSTDKLESGRTAVLYSEEAQSTPLAASQLTIVNNAGESDTIKVSGLTKDDVVSIYDASKVGNILSSETVGTYSSTVNMTITQLGTSGGNVWATVTNSKKLESTRIQVAFSAEVQTVLPDAGRVTIVNNAGIADTVKVSGLVGKDVVNIYDKATAGTLLGSATVGTYDESATVRVDQLGSTTGTVYVTLTSNGYSESERAAVGYTAEPTTNAAASSYITVINNANASDTVKVTGLSSGDIVYVYDAQTGGYQLGTATAGTYAAYVTVTVSQLGSDAGNVYVALKRSGKLESTRTTVPFSAEQTTDAPESTDIGVYNYSGISDIVVVDYLEEGDVVNVYNALTEGTLLGTAVVEDGETVAEATISQISSGSGNIYVSITQKNKLESGRTAASYAAETTTGAPDVDNIEVHNYSTIEDTLLVTYLEENDIVYVYDKAASGTLLGSAAAGAEEDEATIALGELDEDGGTLYVCIKSFGEKVSERTAVVYDEEEQSDMLSLSNIVIENNASGTYDVITVSYLDAYDAVKIYATASSTTVLGKATAGENEDEVSISIKQLGTSSGTIYMTVMNYGLGESARIAVSYCEELTSDAPMDSDITIANNESGTSDKITVTNLMEFDLVKVFSDSSCTTLVGSGSVAEDESEITIKVTQLGTSSGYVYISVTSEGCYESEAAKVGYEAQ